MTGTEAARPVRAEKVFGIGLSKTGTTSLNSALIMLGYNSVHYPCNRYHEILSRMTLYDAATDSPVAAAFQRLDERFPGSKFIWTQREYNSWIISARRHFAVRAVRDRSAIEVRKALFGVEIWDQEAFCDGYWRHNRRVATHFAARPDNLLILDICSGEGWERLCPFLGCTAPLVPFPHENESLLR